MQLEVFSDAIEGLGQILKIMHENIVKSTQENV